jgi:hypothetical protein
MQDIASNNLSLIYQYMMIGIGKDEIRHINRRVQYMAAWLQFSKFILPVIIRRDEWPPFVGQVSVNFLLIEDVARSARRIPTDVFSVF